MRRCGYRLAYLRYLKNNSGYFFSIENRVLRRLPLLAFKCLFRAAMLHFLFFSVQIQAPRVGRPRVVTPEVEEDILQRFEDNPQTSSRAIGNTLDVRHPRVLRVAKENGLRPFHLQKVQKLQPEDFQRRINFANFVINQVEIDEDFLSKIIFTDEARFTRDGKFNIHINHLWSDNNPHGTFVQGHQQRFSVNVWAGMIGSFLIGPYILPHRLNGRMYLRFLQEVLPGLLEEVPPEVRNNMWYQHDGAPPHNLLAVQDHLHQNFPGRWIGTGGPLPWPARSPDFNPKDFFFWGRMN